MEAISFFRKCKFNPKIIIGENVSFGNDIHIGVVSGLTIGNNVLCASNITIMDHDHGGYSDKSTIQSSPEEPPAFRSIVSEPIVIGDNVHIGEYAIVLKGVSIGSGSIIGAGSVVTRSIPKNSIAVGNPARVVKQFDFKYNKWTNVGSSEDSRKVN
jgi:lipopolysaccharide O-acetyltransferase